MMTRQHIHVHDPWLLTMTTPTALHVSLRERSPRQTTIPRCLFLQPCLQRHDLLLLLLVLRKAHENLVRRKSSWIRLGA